MRLRQKPTREEKLAIFALVVIGFLCVFQSLGK